MNAMENYVNFLLLFNSNFIFLVATLRHFVKNIFEVGQFCQKLCLVFKGKTRQIFFNQLFAKNRFNCL
jgi:hypothetical protein